MLVRDTPTAEEVVQNAFVAMHAGWHRLKDTDKALAYLRQTVVNRSRSVSRWRCLRRRPTRSWTGSSSRHCCGRAGRPGLSGKTVRICIRIGDPVSVQA